MPLCGARLRQAVEDATDAVAGLAAGMGRLGLRVVPLRTALASSLRMRHGPQNVWPALKQVPSWFEARAERQEHGEGQGEMEAAGLHCGRPGGVARLFEGSVTHPAEVKGEQHEVG